MPISASLLSCGETLRAYSRALQITQNNVANASTSGYARQSLNFSAASFDTYRGIGGGVRTDEVVSARSEYAETLVRREVSSLGYSEQKALSLNSLESALDVSADSGISSALNDLYDAFSAWGQSPTDSIARDNVIDNAGTVAAAFRLTSRNLDQAAGDAETQLQSTVDTINALASRIASYNRDSIHSAVEDSGLDAQIHSTLEELSEYANVTAVRQENGSWNVLLEGETPLVLGDRSYGLSFDVAEPQNPAPVYDDAPLQAHILSAGNDVTSKIAGGKLGALLEFRNETLAQYRGDSYQQGDLNVLASEFADRVNDILTSGVTSQGPPAAPGSALLSYDAAHPASAAKTLAVAAGVTADSLAAIDPGPPVTSNGIPLRLAALAEPVLDDDKLDGTSFQEYYATLAAKAGSGLSEANEDADTRKSVVAQARELREQLSGVSLDEEAMNVLQFQRAYQAVSRLISVLDELTQDDLNMIR
jgi:flagellar hook-associated protein 1